LRLLTAEITDLIAEITDRVTAIACSLLAIVGCGTAAPHDYECRRRSNNGIACRAPGIAN
jgi:hypothetical protein